MSDFVALLEALSLPDNTIRSAAEKTYQQMKVKILSYLLQCFITRLYIMKENEESLLPMHLLDAVAQQSVNVKERQMAAVLLRRILVEEEESAYYKLSEQQ